MPDQLSDVEHVRTRPAMYIGSDGLFGSICYLVCPFDLLLPCSPRNVRVAVRAEGYEITADASLSIDENVEGLIVPFETVVRNGPSHGVEGLILNALSKSLSVRAVTANRSWEIDYEDGKQTRLAVRDAANEKPSTSLCFQPEAKFFRVSEISPFNFLSYLNRLSYLYAGTRFHLSLNGGDHEFCSQGGIRDLFDSVAAPFQVLHEPIHIRGSADSLELELVFAYHSWTRNWVWPFINRGRAVEGGPHETGLLAAFEDLCGELGIPSEAKGHRNGVIAVMSLIYPELTWEGCIKSEIANPELHDLVRQIVVDQTLQWVSKHPDVKRQLQELQPFQFPDIWST